MDQLNKICAACRKEIDKAAVICSYCRSEIDYQYLIDIPVSSPLLNKSQNSFISVFSYLATTIVCLVIIGLFGLYGFLFSGFWVGSFSAGMGIIVALSLLGVLLKTNIFGSVVANLTCHGCKQSFYYKWPINSIEPKANIFFECSSCKQKTRVVIQPATT